MYIGVDPGLTGAVGVVDEDGRVVGVHDLPVLIGKNRSKELHLPQIVKLIREMVGDAEGFAAVERVHAMPKQGVRSCFRFGKATGHLEGICSALGYQLILVTPQSWQKQFTRFVDGADTKVKSVLAASYKRPDVDLPRKKDHNKAEALLIAEFCRLHHQNKLKQ